MRIQREEAMDIQFKLIVIIRQLEAIPIMVSLILLVDTPILSHIMETVLAQ